MSPRRDDLAVIRLRLLCPHKHPLGALVIDRDTARLQLIGRHDADGDPLHHGADKLRYRCGTCVRTAQAQRTQRPQSRALPWRTVAAVAAALACGPADNLNRALVATPESLRAALLAFVPDGEPRPDGYADYLARWRVGPST